MGGGAARDREEGRGDRGAGAAGPAGDGAGGGGGGPAGGGPRPANVHPPHWGGVSTVDISGFLFDYKGMVAGVRGLLRVFRLRDSTSQGRSR